MGSILGAMCHSKARLDGKTVIVTGCNTGIGKENAREFYRRGELQYRHSCYNSALNNVDTTQGWKNN